MKNLLEVQGLKKYYPHGGSFFRGPTGWVKALDGVSFSVTPGTTFGLVGESGCGKTTLGRILLALLPPTEGRVLFEGQDIFQLSGGDLNRLRRNMQMVFQDPSASLNPGMLVEDIVAEPLVVHRVCQDRPTLQGQVKELLALVGLPANYGSRFPRECSQGQRQRIAIARALALKPAFVVCDEPVSALDVSIGVQIISLLRELQKELNLTYLFISHDLGVVKYISHVVAVMYLGELVEVAPAGDLFSNPLHPYTKALLAAVPAVQPRDKKKGPLLTGELPSPLDRPGGCPFHPRCPGAAPICRVEEPELKAMGAGRQLACHFSS